MLFTQYIGTWLTAISSHCHAALPAKMSAFNIVTCNKTPATGRWS